MEAKYNTSFSTSKEANLGQFLLFQKHCDSKALTKHSSTAAKINLSDDSEKLIKLDFFLLKILLF